MKHTIRAEAIAVFIAIAVLLFATPNRLEAQRGQGGGGPAPPAARAVAPIDPTGYWVSLVTEDWRFRMGAGVRGEYGRTTVPINAKAREVADSWDPEADEAAGLECKPFGGAGIMRVPGRLNITWLDDDTLQIEADAGMQTRTLHFGPTTPPTGEPTWQGHSVARWEFAGAPPRGQFGAGGGPPSDGGELVVVTANMRPGYYFQLDGLPYGESAVMTEHFTRVTEPNGDEYFLITLMVDDPEYLNNTYIRTVAFKKEPDGSNWNPRPCTVYVPPTGGSLIERFQ